MFRAAIKKFGYSLPTRPPLPTFLADSRSQTLLKGNTRPTLNATRCYAVSELRRSEAAHQHPGPGLTAGLDHEKRFLKIHSNDGEESFPFVWLRDNCQCAKCFDPNTKSRKILAFRFDPKISPTDVTVSDTGEEIALTWPDGHVSVFTSSWLKSRSFQKDAIEKRLKKYGTPQKLWGSELEIPRHDFEEVMVEDIALLNFLEDLDCYGLTLVYNTPAKPNQLLRLERRIAYLRITNYGGLFTVKAKEDPNNLAYTGEPLGLHMDLPFYQYSPGIQCLHCVKQADGLTGGENQFVDTFHVAKQLKIENPEAFHILTTVPVDFYDIGFDSYKFHVAFRRPIYQLDKNGEPEGCYYNNQVRSYELNVPLEQVQPLYDAMKALNNAFYDQRNLVNVRLRSGDIAIFDNIRCQHGREGFANASGGRHLDGAYFDWDEARSRMRVLREDLGMDA